MNQAARKLCSTVNLDILQGSLCAFFRTLYWELLRDYIIAALFFRFFSVHLILIPENMLVKAVRKCNFEQSDTRSVGLGRSYNRSNHSILVA